ncbi:MAG TPA: 5'-methylthioadenosine/adenosylhomocysteine nucleosidase [Ottowia sp.]|uniref:5'-methylthioadenosine/adenosylhomocysteine nucleosidase n=1 Tax=Ottowia sp. TaxID=1898956 RepID=UPI002B7E9FC6|nr:5'-methylthioadenosine/adenosylhomocysteine nucleosidase [Ottowia sp.]HMN19967.1 5'-methylthioadenosine/adenosylhomocysteine nucleosidase [Ottowia sp.]
MPRRIGIVSALHEELAAVLALLPDDQVQTIAGREFRRGHWHGQELVTVLSRVGKVAAATTATVLIERFGVEQIVFTGTAGGLGEGVAVGDVVVADAFLQHDIDASPLFPRHEVPLYGRSRFPADPALAARLAHAARHVLARPERTLGPDAVRDFALARPRVHTGLVVSGDRFVATAGESTALRQELPQALAVEMEGAAMAQVCLDYGVRFAALRTVSDRADDSAHVDFSRFAAQVASRYSAAMLEAYLQQVLADDAPTPA